jgi:hypothetical protein
LTPNFVCAVTSCAIFALQVGSDTDGVAADIQTRVKTRIFFFLHLISPFFVAGSVECCRLRLGAHNYNVFCHYFMRVTRDSATMIAAIF